VEKPSRSGPDGLTALSLVRALWGLNWKTKVIMVTMVTLIPATICGIPIEFALLRVIVNSVIGGVDAAQLNHATDAIPYLPISAPDQDYYCRMEPRVAELYDSIANLYEFADNIPSGFDDHEMRTYYRPVSHRQLAFVDFFLKCGCCSGSSKFLLLRVDLQSGGELMNRVVRWDNYIPKYPNPRSFVRR
jgi:hypothetical protein